MGTFWNYLLRFSEVIGNMLRRKRELYLNEAEYLSRKEASNFLRRIGCPISARGLEKMAANNNAGNGPPYRKFRWKAVSYSRADLIAWAQRETKIVGELLT